MNENGRLCLPLLLDGATGTQYMKAGMPSGVCVEQWASEHPEVIRQVVCGYADAGSDIVYAPTFLANAGSLAAYGLEGQVSALNRKIVGIAREALDGRASAKLAGDMSTTGLMCEPFGEVPFARLLEIYDEQAQSLAEAGVDLLVIETMSSLSECRAAVISARKTGLPIFLSMTVNGEGRTMWGDDILASMLILQDMGISAFGLNCSEGPDDMVSLFERIAPYAKVPLIAKPNSGNPPLTPIQFSDRCARLMRRGVSIIGGCCGTDPEYIAALRHMVDNFDVESGSSRLIMKSWRQRATYTISITVSNTPSRSPARWIWRMHCSKSRMKAATRCSSGWIPRMMATSFRSTPIWWICR